MKVHVYEKLFLSLGGIMMVAFLGALGYATFGAGIHLPGDAGMVDPATVARTAPFNHPGVHQLGPGRYEVVMLGSAWAYMPNEVHVPAGAEITFVATSLDVIHGFELEGTRLNMMLIPGRISRNTYTFKAPGEHLLICHEYCGLGHQTMYGKVIVE